MAALGLGLVAVGASMMIYGGKMMMAEKATKENDDADEQHVPTNLEAGANIEGKDDNTERKDAAEGKKNGTFDLEIS